MATVHPADVEAVRRFNRFYTQRIGVLEARHLGSRFSLTESRVLYELAQRSDWTASALGQALGLDAGYLSRTLTAFARDGLVERRRDGKDKRSARLVLTAAGRRAFGPLDGRARDEVGTLLAPLAAGDQGRLVAAMATVAKLLGGRLDLDGAVPAIREQRPGDLGWVVERHGALYAEEYGWNVEFEALVADIVARFGQAHDAERERAFIAEHDGVRAGSIFVVKKSATVAQLRLLLVEPWARGSGLGARLVDVALRFAREAGYKRMTLWTNSVLGAARRLYERAGFVLVGEEPHQAFGHALTSQTWQRPL
jgi:DNA-binding MarR family transcriptional regulator/GNAT superfamily N-acetyltransferase